MRSRQAARSGLRSGKKVAHAFEGEPRFCGASNFPFEHMVQGKLSVQRVKEVEAIHADDTLASTECSQAVCGEPTVAHEQAASPGCFLVHFSVECVQIGRASLLGLPLRLNEISLTLQHKAAVNLFAAMAERLPRFEAEAVERLLEPCFKSVAARMRRQC